MEGLPVIRLDDEEQGVFGIGAVSADQLYPLDGVVEQRDRPPFAQGARLRRMDLRDVGASEKLVGTTVTLRARQ